MLSTPDVMTLANGDDAHIRDLHGNMTATRKNAGDRMTDAPPNLLPQDVLEPRMNTAGYDSKMAALYYPWIEVMNPLTKRPMMIPPSGHVAGVWCRVDDTRGVHKAPANEVILGANGLGFQVTHAEQGGLNKVGINGIRVFPGRGIRIWARAPCRAIPSGATSTSAGCSTTSPSRSWTARSGPCSSPTTSGCGPSCGSRRRTSLAQPAALFGSYGGRLQAERARGRLEMQPAQVIEAGQVVCEIGIAPVKPAEFVIFRLSQFTGGAGSEVAE